MSEVIVIIEPEAKEVKTLRDMVTSVSIPDSVTEICDFAFKDCSSLKSLDIPNSVTKIGKCAFYSCTSLTSITIPSSVSKIGWCAFNGCFSLESVYINKEKGSLDLSKVEIPKGATVYWKGEF